MHLPLPVERKAPKEHHLRKVPTALSLRIRSPILHSAFRQGSALAFPPEINPRKQTRHELSSSPVRAFPFLFIKYAITERRVTIPMNMSLSSTTGTKF